MADDDAKKAGKEVKKFFRNYWAIAAVVLAILLALSYFIGPFGNISGKSAGQKIVDFAKSQGVDAQVVNVTSQGSLYEVIVSIGNQTVPTYITKDGKYFISAQGMVPLSEISSPTDTSDSSTSTTEIPQTDKPKVELYVFSYCPYGTQSEKGLIPAAKLLGDKIDFKIRQIGAMHGEFEAIEAQRQLCIEQNYPTKYLDYALKFALDAGVGTCGGEATCVAPKINAIYTSLSIDKNKIDSCMNKNGAALYSAEEANAQAKSVSGSPTLIINGVDAQAGRDSASYLKAICSAFTTAPAECSQTLSAVQPSAGFGSSTSSDAASAASCG